MSMIDEVRVMRDMAMVFSNTYLKEYREDKLIDKFAASECHANYYQWLDRIIKKEEEYEKVSGKG